MILFQAFWLNVVVPGHTRGSVSMLGDCCASVPAAHAAMSDCCAMSDKPHPPPCRGHSCAICSFAAHQSVPPAIICPPPRPMPVAYVPAERARSLFAPVTVLPFDCCGPPVCA